MLTKPKYGWADFQIAGSPSFPLSYLIADLAYKWLDSAIDGLEHGKPFSVEGEMEPELFVCDVDSNSCRIRQYSGWVPSDLKFANPTDLVFDCTYPVSMIEFCKSLYADISENVDDWADFQMDRGNEWFDSEVFGKARQLLLEKLAHLRSTLESKGIDVPSKRENETKYNILSFETRMVEVEQAASEKEKYLAFFYLIDGIRIENDDYNPADAFDVLDESADERNLVILNHCGCGIWECSSLVARVSETDEGAIEWEVDQLRYIDDPRTYFFEKTAYEKTMAEVRKLAEIEIERIKKTSG